MRPRLLVMALLAAIPAGAPRAEHGPQGVWNDAVRVGVTQDRDHRLVSLRDRRAGLEYVTPREDGDFWRVQMLAPDGQVHTFRSSGSECFRSSFGYGGGQLDWRVPLGESEMIVSVEIRLPDDTARTEWRLSVETPSPDWAPWWMELVIPGLGVPGETDVIERHYRHEAPAERLSGHFFGDQLVLLPRKGGTLYVAAEDPEHLQKGFELEVGQEFVLRVPPPGMGLPGECYHQPFPLVVQPVAGDWWQGADLYRRWAMRQRWWRIKRPRAEAEQALRDVRLWLTAMNPLTKDPRDVPPRAIEIAEAVGVPAGIHWYNWANEPFMPDLFPARGAFYAAAREAEEAGLLVMPYVNVLHHVRKDRFPLRDAASVASEPPACGRVVDGLYHVQVGKWSMAPMCRGAREWVEFCAQQALRLHEEGGFRAVYLDQAASPPRWPCFDRTHGHPAGGGSYWAKGTIDIPRRIKQLTGGDMAISGEGRFEGYLPYVDLDLSGYWTEPGEYLPLYEFLYPYQAATFASVMADEPIDSFVYKVGVRGLYGAAARVSTEIIEQPEKVAFLREILGAQVAAAHLIGHELLRPPDLLGEPQAVDLKGFLLGKRRPGATVTVPRVHIAAWTTTVDRVALLVLNVSREPATARIDLAGWERTPEGAWRLLDASGHRLHEAAQPPDTLEVEVPARSVRIIELGWLP